MNPSQKRASLILQVRAGQMTAQAAAQELGISRQAYYKWEQRALSALLRSLEDQPPGRPPTPIDSEKDQLRQQVAELEKKVRLYEEREGLRALLKELEESEEDSGSSTKKNSK